MRSLALFSTVAVALIVGAAFVGSPPTASGQAVTPTPAAGAIVSGSIPPSGFGLIVWGGGTPQQLVTASRCTEPRLAFWFTVAGEFVTYVPHTTVSAVNEAFLAMFATNIPANTPLVALCGQEIPSRCQVDYYAQRGLVKLAVSPPVPRRGDTVTVAASGIGQGRFAVEVSDLSEFAIPVAEAVVGADGILRATFTMPVVTGSAQHYWGGCLAVTVPGTPGLQGERLVSPMWLDPDWQGQ